MEESLIERLSKLVQRLLNPAGLRKAPLDKEDVLFVVVSMKKQLMAINKPLIDVSAPVVVLGDTHGQYRDVLRHFDRWGFPPGKTFLFLGDYVDRGPRSIEVVCLLFSMKLIYPNSLFLLRGNHETREISRYYGFYDECSTRFESKVWEEFNKCFDYLPLAALISNKMLCMHGGIPRKLKNLDEIKNLSLPISSVRDNDIVCDLLWSDPAEEINGFKPNARGLGCSFGPEDIADFCRNHDLDMVIRAHQVFKEGYKQFGGQLISVFSAPKYGGEFDNNGGVVIVTAKLECKIDAILPIDEEIRQKHAKAATEAKERKEPKTNSENEKSNASEGKNTSESGGRSSNKRGNSASIALANLRTAKPPE